MNAAPKLHEAPSPTAPSYDPIVILREEYGKAHRIVHERSFEKLMGPADPIENHQVIGHLTESEFRTFAKGFMAKLAAVALTREMMRESGRASRLLEGSMQELIDRLGLPISLDDSTRGPECPQIDARTGALITRSPDPKAELPTHVNGVSH